MPNPPPSSTGLKLLLLAIFSATSNLGQTAALAQRPNEGNVGDSLQDGEGFEDFQAAAGDANDYNLPHKTSRGGLRRAEPHEVSLQPDPYHSAGAQRMAPSPRPSGKKVLKGTPPGSGERQSREASSGDAGGQDPSAAGPEIKKSTSSTQRKGSSSPPLSSESETSAQADLPPLDFPEEAGLPENQDNEALLSDSASASGKDATGLETPQRWEDIDVRALLSTKARENRF